MKYTSTKTIELGSCAFRQWRATDTHCCKIHGYQLNAKFWFEGELDDRNWVVNFGGLKALKAELQEQFDHTLCVAVDDPLISLFQQLHNNGGCELKIMASVGVESTAKFCFGVAKKHVQEMTAGRCKVTKVEVWEHEANSAIYEEQY
jgi:6-pyruvoyltetrahydropterin/6-carboxytetrahydropterin synthase